MADIVSTTRDGTIAIVTIDNPPVNAAGQAVRAGLLAAFDELAEDHTVEAIVLTCAGRTFVAGADIREFGKPPAAPALTDLVSRIEAMPHPVVAALHGTTLGGGLELALGCHVRVAMPGTQLGLPETTLGIIPGAGGTQRLPRLVGLERALAIIPAAVRVSADQALADGLIDAIASEATPREAGLAQARRLNGKKPERPNALAGRSEADPAFAAALARLDRSHPGQTAPRIAVEAIRAALTGALSAGLKRERALFAECVSGPQRAALVHLFFAERAATKIKQAPEPRPIAKVGIIGAGTMGGGIAMACAAVGLETVLIDRDRAAVDAALTRIRDSQARAVARGKLSEGKAASAAACLSGTTEIDALGDAGLAIEAVFESMEVKHSVFRTLDTILPQGALLASNTSALDIDRIAEATQRPEDVLGLHFFSPAHVMKLVEVVQARATSAEALATAMAFARSLRKVPVPVGMVPGFVGNRMLFHYGREAEFLLEEGASPEAVDTALTTFGMAMGPFAMRDLSGNDVGHAIRAEWRRLYSDHRFPGVLDALVEAGRLGQKTRAGYYDYAEGDRTPRPSDEVASLLTARAVPRREMDVETIRDRTILALVNEGARLVGDGAARRASDIDVIYRYGYGFPAWRGGPMFYAETRGLPEILDRLRAFEALHGAWWVPAPLIERCVAEGRGFADL